MKTMIKGVSTFSALVSCLTLGATAAGEPVEATLPAAVIPLYAVLLVLCVLTGCGTAFLLSKIVRPRTKPSPVMPEKMPETEEQTSPEDTAVIEEQAPPDDASLLSGGECPEAPYGGDEVFDYPDFS